MWVHHGKTKMPLSPRSIGQSSHGSHTSLSFFPTSLLLWLAARAWPAKPPAVLASRPPAALATIPSAVWASRPTTYMSKNPRIGYVNYRDLDLGTNEVEGNVTSYAKARIWGRSVSEVILRDWQLWKPWWMLMISLWMSWASLLCRLPRDGAPSDWRSSLLECTMLLWWIGDLLSTIVCWLWIWDYHG